jgi:acyl-CoA synthetase (AMP-forming)/AMP-acid ligase II
MIIRAGQNIYPVELEDLMVTHPKISQVTVVGVPDAFAGEKVVAFIIPEGGKELEKIEVHDFCRTQMAPYKIPAEVFFVDEFPLNATGKVLKRDLREKVLAEG